MEKAQTLKRIQSRVLVRELSQEEMNLVSGAGCNPTAKVFCDNSGCKVEADIECDF